jgi:glycosyl hydrolase family 2
VASGPGLGRGIAAGPVRRTRISQGYLLDSGKLKDFAPGEGVAAGAFAERFDSGGWIEVRIPGDVHRALMAAGRIEDPFYDRNEERCAWVEERKWWYRRRILAPNMLRISWC